MKKAVSSTLWHPDWPPASLSATLEPPSVTLRSYPQAPVEDEPHPDVGEAGDERTGEATRAPEE